MYRVLSSTFIFKPIDLFKKLYGKCQHFAPPVGESPPADTDALEYAVAGELVHHQTGVNHTWLLVVVGHDAPDEVRVGGVEGREEGIQLRLEGGGDRLVGLLALLLALLLGGVLGLACKGRNRMW